jgi:hypothetical protein
MSLDSCFAIVMAGTVATTDLGVETVAPVIAAAVATAPRYGPNGWYRNTSSITLGASDGCICVAGTGFSAGGGITWKP